MTVAELIKELEKYPKDMVIWLRADDKSSYTDFGLETFIFTLCDSDDECIHLKIKSK